MKEENTTIEYIGGPYCGEKSIIDELYDTTEFIILNLEKENKIIYYQRINNSNKFQYKKVDRIEG